MLLSVPGAGDRALVAAGRREGGVPVIITVKRFDNKAQGRREGGAPWVQRQKVRGTPLGNAVKHFYQQFA